MDLAIGFLFGFAIGIVVGSVGVYLSVSNSGAERPPPMPPKTDRCPRCGSRWHTDCHDPDEDRP